MSVGEKIAEEKVIAIVRLEDLSEARSISEALLKGGVSVVEFTLTNPDALRVMGKVREDVDGSEHIVAVEPDPANRWVGGRHGRRRE